MTFRMRLTALAALAVALALIGASFVVYYSYQRDAIRQVDGELGASLATASVKQLLSNNPTGRARLVVLPGSSTALTARSVPSASVTPALVEGVKPFEYRTVTVHGVSARQLTILGPNSAVTVTRSLGDVQHSLDRLRWLLIFTCLGGAAAAALLGTLVSGRAIAPLRRLTETTERIAATGELSVRTGQRGRDEISRLSRQLDALLTTLEQSLRSQRQLVADASHELRTPLATLRVNVGLLASIDALDPDERRELVADVEAELESMTALVGELVELAQGEELEIEPKEFRLDELVRAAVDRAAKRTSDVSFRAELEPTTIRGQRERVERAVDNLLDNARKWSPAGETIDVTVSNGVVEVRDRGPGIAIEDAPLVFNRFYRSLKARGTPGAGLGLAIVKQVADAHNGSVLVEDAPGGGAILRLSLLPSR